MKNSKIHISHFLSLNKFNLKTLTLDELNYSMIKEKVHGICFDVFRYDSEIISMNFNKQLVSFNQKSKNKTLKFSNNREYSILYYISKYPDSFTSIKANNFFFTSFLKNYLFNSRIKLMQKFLYKCVKEVESYFPREETKREIRVFYLKKNIFVADESFLRLEISNFYFNSIYKFSNLELERKINDYYTISNNLQNLEFLEKRKVMPLKNSNLFKFLPNKINDKNFFLMSRMENEKINLYELFIDNYVNSYQDMINLKERLKDFTKNYFHFKIKQSFDLLYLNHRRQFRLDIKKKYGLCKEDKLLQLFLDNLIFFTRDYDKFEEIIKGFIEHIETFYV